MRTTEKRSILNQEFMLFILIKKISLKSTYKIYFQTGVLALLLFLNIRKTNKVYETKQEGKTLVFALGHAI